jgi:hypothetical protein
MSEIELHICAATDLDALASWGKRHVRRIRVDIGAAASPGAAQLIDAINRDLRACGCVEAAVASAAALLTLPAVWAVASGSPFVLSSTLVAYVFGAALLGKIVGLLLAEWRLARNVRAIRRLLAAHCVSHPDPKAETHPVAAGSR